MDAKDFIRERNRMCSKHAKCFKCPAQDIADCGNLQLMPPELVDIVEKWTKEHPIVTNRSKFTEIFGKQLRVSEPHDGYLFIYELGASKKLTEEWLNAEYIKPTETTHETKDS